MDKKVVAELTERAVPLTGSDPNLEDKELICLDFLGSVSVVGLGEATHGTREFFQMKHRIFKYLVEHHGFKIFAFECDFGESIYFNRYIHGDYEKDRIESLMKDCMRFWTWRTEEVRDLFIWMREYNQNKNTNQKIEYIGIDCQNMKHKPVLIKEYLNRIDPNYLKQIEPVLNEIEEMTAKNKKAASSKKYNYLQGNLEKTIQKMVQNRDEYRRISTEWEYQACLQCIRTIMQALEVKKKKNSGNSFLRDKYMAENVKWIQDVMGKETKIAVWAHNLHIAKRNSLLNKSSMGYYLSEIFGGNYKAVGFSFSLGSFAAVQVDTKNLSIDLPRKHYLKVFNVGKLFRISSIGYLFAANPNHNFILRLDNLEDGALKSWLSVSREFLNIGAVFGLMIDNFYIPVPVTQLFDILIHFKETHYARNLHWN